MKFIGKRLLAGVLAILLTVGLFPSEGAFAAEIGTEQNSPASGAQHVITGFAGLTADQSAVNIRSKVSEELLAAGMPASLEVYLDGNTDTVSIPVTWHCVGDYQGTNYYTYEFDPQWDSTVYTLGSNLSGEIPYIGVFITPSSSLKMGSASSNEQKIYNFLKNKLGLNTAAACGALANIQSESSFNPLAQCIDTNGKISFGICQWNGSRYDALQSFCNQRGYDYRTLTGQLNYLKYEFQTTEKSAFSRIVAVENTKQGAYDAGYNWARYFERCASVYFEFRAKLARDTYWARYGNGEVTPTPEKKEKYSITYYLDEGTNDSGNPSSYTNQSEDITLKEPKKTGYTFAGWYKESSRKNKITVITKGTTGNLNLYAKWNANKYTIEFDGNKSTSGSTPTMQSVEYDNTYTLKANKFKRTGFKFKGWNTKKNGSGTSYANREEIENLTALNGAKVTLYAQWIRQTYQITYKPNGGTLPAGCIQKYNVNTKTYNLKNPKRKGYTFGGWYTDKKFKNRITQIKNGSAGNLTLYAKWTVNKYSTIYNGNGATSGSMSSLSNCKYGKAYILSSNKYKRTDYIFDGWNTKADGSGTYYQNKEEIKNLTSKNNKTVTLYAQWRKKEYTINYELNGGTVVKSNPQTYYGDTKTFKLNAPQREGYTFRGWYTDSNFSNKIAKIKKGTRKNFKLYAKWSVNKYTVQFNGNGATGGAMNALTSCQYDQTYTLPQNTFQRPGYRFVGWSTAADGSNTFYGDQALIQNLTSANGTSVTLYAQWEADSRSN